MNQTDPLTFEVANEQGVVVAFAQHGPRYGFVFESVQVAFPDAIVLHKGVRYRVEFEYRARSFVHHRHDPRECDLIICWRNDYSDSILPVLALSNPDWPHTSLELPDALTRELVYWRERALFLERHLTRRRPTPYAKAKKPRMVQSVTPNQKVALLALHAQGLSERDISYHIFGQNNEQTRTRIRRVLESADPKAEATTETHQDALYPFPPERPPNPEEQAYMRWLFRSGLSRNRICRTVYGFKNGKVYGWVNEVLAELDEEDEEIPLE